MRLSRSHTTQHHLYIGLYMRYTQTRALRNEHSVKQMLWYACICVQIQRQNIGTTCSSVSSGACYMYWLCAKSVPSKLSKDTFMFDIDCPSACVYVILRWDATETTQRAQFRRARVTIDGWLQSCATCSHWHVAAAAAVRLHRSTAWLPWLPRKIMQSLWSSDRRDKSRGIK